jgi:hypothetical protein
MVELIENHEQLLKEAEESEDEEAENTATVSSFQKMAPSPSGKNQQDKLSTTTGNESGNH